MNCREFLSAGAAGIGCPPESWRNNWQTKPKRVGIIGPGWYSKCRPIPPHQVSPSRWSRVRRRQANARRPPRWWRRGGARKDTAFWRCEMLRERSGHLIVDTPDHWHTLPMIAAVRPSGRLGAEADQRGHRRGQVWSPRRERRACAGGHAASRYHTLVEARDRSFARQTGQVGLVKSTLMAAGRRGITPEMEPPANLDYECGPARRNYPSSAATSAGAGGNMGT
jgi:hypothetical protein